MKQLLGSILVAAVITTAAEAQTVRKVPGNHPTIQAAINAAQSGDTVLVAPGIYVENITFSGKAITVVSQAGPDFTTIDGNQISPVVRFVTGEGPSAVLEGFTIRNGYESEGAGIRIYGASPTVRRNRVVNNRACGGTGIMIYDGSPLIQSNTISGNTTSGCSGSGGAILITFRGSPQILDNTITNNVTQGLVFTGTTAPLIQGNIITGNQGSGIDVRDLSSARILQNLIAGNMAGGIYWSWAFAGSQSITNNTIVDNDRLQGSAIFADGADSSTVLRNNIIVGKKGQTAIYCGNTYDDTSPPAFAYNDVFAEQAAAYGGICTDATGTNGNISAAPSFVDRAAGNLRLLSGSSGIDAGDNSALNLPAVDLDTIPRILSGTVDMGAYEFAAATTSTLSQLSLTFADQDAGTISAPTDITLTNTGSATLVVSSVAVSGEFSQTNTCQTLSGIPAGQFCTISVRFAPTAGGSRSGQLTIGSNSGGSAVSLSGNGIGALVLSETAISFGSIRVGTTVQATVNVSNTGVSDLSIGSITTTGVDFTSSNDCPASLASGTACTVTIQFAPTARETRYGAVTINSNVAGGPHIITFSGRGVAPTISFSPASFGLGPQEVGSTSTRKVTISNQGDLALVLNSISVTGDFTSTTDCGSSLAVNATCDVTVVFSPTSVGLKNGAITVTDDAIGSPHTVSFSGLAVSVLLTQSPTSVNFGNQPVNVASSEFFVTLRNMGLGFSHLALSIAASGEFSTTGNNCTPFFPGSTCFVSVNFTPTSIGAKTGSLTIMNPSFASPHVVPLSGMGIDVALSPSSIFFSNIQAGTTATRAVTFTNNSPNTVTITNISTTTGFSQQNDCGASLASGANCTINVTFAPITAMSTSGLLTITDDALGSPHYVPLGGRGVAGFVSLSGTNLVFVPDRVGSSSPAQVISLWNSGEGLLTFASISASGDFAQTNNCGTTLAANATCTISVKFQPTAEGVRNGSLTIASDAPGSPHSVPLTGTGLAFLPVPVITSLSDENRLLGSPDLTLTVTGSGFSALSVVRWNGADRPTTFVNPTTLTAVFPASDFTAVGTVFISVFNPPPGGGVSDSVAFTVYRALTLSANDLVYDRIGARIYASVSATSPTLANTLTPIDPATGAFGTSIAIGSNPAALAISRDSAHMYVALNGTLQVRHFNIRSQTADTPFGVGGDPFFGGYRARDIAIDPTNPETIAVSRMFGTSSGHRGVAIFDSGVKRPVETDFFTHVSTVIAFSDNPSVLYGYNNETTEHGFRTMLVDNQGVAVTNVQTNLINGSLSDIQFEDGRLYISNGQVIDPVNRTVVGTFPLPTLPSPLSVKSAVVDLSLGRAFFLQETTSSFLRILAFDLNTFALVGTMKLPLQVPAGNLVRWGQDGLAYRSLTQVFIVRIPESWLSTTPTVTLAPNAAQQDQTLNVAVTGQFTGFAQGQTTANFGAGVTVNSVTVSDSTHAVVNITIAPGAAAGLRNVTMTTGNQPPLSTVFTVDSTQGLLAAWGLFTVPPTDYPSGLFKAIAVGNTHGLALQKDGTLVGWGSNVYGQTNIPVGTFTAIAAGPTHSLAIRTDGTLTGWGDNANGQINVPPGTFRAIAAGALYSLAIRTDGTLAGWGFNNFGQTLVPEGTFTAIAAGFAHGLAIRTDGTLAGWGSNNQGQINVPSGTFAAIAGGDSFSLALRTDGTLVAWGDNTYGQTDVPAGTFTAIAATKYSGLAIRSDGTLVGWGLNASGQTNVPAGRFSAIAAGGFYGLAIRSATRAPRDFNGDGKSDVLWRDTAGNVSLWQMNGFTITSDTFIANIWIGWTIVGSGDFNGDGKADVLWRDPSGNAAVWLMDGATVSGYGVVGNMPLSTTVSGVADFNGDGKADILWRTGSGDVVMWLINGTSITSNTLIGNLWTGWTIAGTGDFNGDGQADVLWRDVTGNVAIWLMNGSTVSSGTLIGNIWTGWTIVGTGDFNGDGKADILWREISGDVAMWLMNGTTVASGAVVANVWPGFAIVGARDFDGNGRADILWRDSSGNVAIWLMNGTTVSSYAGLGNVSDRMAQ